VQTLFRDRPRRGAIDAPSREPRAFHRALEDYRPTPLLAQPELAVELGVRHLDIKLEIDRLGLPSFKVMGASWATIEALRPVLPPSWTPDQGLVALAGALPALTLVAATEGNHGRAVARIASLLGLHARIFVPDDVADARVAPIAAEGAEVIRVAGSYDDAVARSATDAQGDGRVLVSDTSWPGYERIPAAVVDGYSTILWEVEEQLAATGRGLPDLVLVQLGVGSFGAAVIRHFRRPAPQAPRIVGVEPVQAACVLASLAADRRLTIPGPHETLMAGLNCGTPSLIAWPLLREGLDGVVALDDDAALEGVRTLAERGIAVGECSGVAVAAARELLAGAEAASHRERLGVWSESSVLLFATEGVTS
jgi:diaminopropionate ammonia-lyase